MPRPLLGLLPLALLGCRAGGGDPPSAPEIAISPESPTAGDDLRIEILTESTDPEEASVVYRFFWSRDEGAFTQGESVLTAGSTAKGQTWTARVIPSDGAQNGEAAEASVTIGNSPPTLASVDLTGGSPSEPDLTCGPGAATDRDGDAITFSFRWLVNGAAISATGSTLEGSAVAGGDQVICEVTPNDGESDGAPVQSPKRTVGNTLPVVASVRIGPAGARTDDDLVCTALGAYDADGHPVSFSYVWTVGGVRNGATGETLPASETSKGTDVVCVVTPSDGVDDGAPVASPALVVANTPPTLAGATLGPSSPTGDDVLTCSPGAASDADGDTVSFLYVWKADGVQLFGSAEKLDPAATRRGQSVTCTVTPFDGESEGGSVTTSAVVVGNSAPVVTSVSISPDPASAATELTCAALGSDSDADVLKWTYTWTVGSATASGGATLAPSKFSRGDKVSCTATVSDGTATSAPMKSSEVTVVNAVPRVVSLGIQPSAVYTNDRITLAPVVEDGDGDPVTLKYEWWKNGAKLSTTASSLPGLTMFDRDDVIQVAVTPSDTSSTGDTLKSGAIRVLNDIPSTPEVRFDYRKPRVGKDLVCNLKVGSTDLDGDTMSYEFAWTVDGKAYAGTTKKTAYDGDTIPGAQVKLGQLWRCTVTPDDGADVGLSAFYEETAVDRCVGIATDPTETGPFTIDTRSHGGGFMPIAGKWAPDGGQYWYPQWSNNQIFRYDLSRNFLGVVNTQQGEVMDLYGDEGNVFYTANWGYGTITKQKWDGGSSATTQWTYSMGDTAGAVAADEDYVYAMPHWSEGNDQVHLIDKSTGKRLDVVTLGAGGRDYYNHGGLAVADTYLYVGRSDSRTVDVYDIDDDFAFVDSFSVQRAIYNRAFDGRDYCVSDNSSQVWCYEICAF